MAYTLDEFVTDCRAALEADPGPGGRENVRKCLERALRDEAFVASHLGSDATREREVIYEDEKLGFCICAHVYDGARKGEPHDHGPTWAIYGQAVGETEMTDWRIVSPPEGGRPGKVEMDGAQLSDEARRRACLRGRRHSRAASGRRRQADPDRGAGHHPDHPHAP